MARKAARRLDAPPERTRIALALDCRYEGQGYDLIVPLDEASERGVADARARFHVLHDAVYGHAAPDEPVEIVALRVTASVPGGGFRPSRLAGGGSASAGTVAKVFDGRGWVEAPAFDRDDLPAGWTSTGPLLVREAECTTWVPKGWRLDVDELGSLEVTRG
jgi:N-methylhydantoinase A